VLTSVFSVKCCFNVSSLDLINSMIPCSILGVIDNGICVETAERLVGVDMLFDAFIESIRLIAADFERVLTMLKL
jgi:hypothetical protein